MKKSHWLLGLVMLAVVAIVIALAFQTPTNDHSEEIVILSYGGDFAAAQRAAFFDPFTEATGVTVTDSD